MYCFIVPLWSVAFYSIRDGGRGERINTERKVFTLRDASPAFPKVSLLLRGRCVGLGTCEPSQDTAKCLEDPGLHLQPQGRRPELTQSLRPSILCEPTIKSAGRAPAPGDATRKEGAGKERRHVRKRHGPSQECCSLARRRFFCLFPSPCPGQGSRPQRGGA